MDIGSEFDDDFFEEPKVKEGKEPSDYEAKVCVPLWYMQNENEAAKDPAERLVALKHQADYHYFSRDYAKACEAYERCLDLLPSSNNTWKREFMENLSRCHLHLGNTEKALEWSLKLHETSFSPDQKVIALNLLATVCHKLGKYKEELEALHCCIQTHKSCPEFWLRLGLCYAGLFKIDLPGCSLLRSNLDPDPPCCAFNNKSGCQTSEEEGGAKVHSESATNTTGPGTSSSSSSQGAETSSNGDENVNATLKCELCTLGVQIVSSCLIHTRVLLDSSGPNLLGSERDEKIRDKIALSLKHMEVDQSFIDVAAKMLGTDFLSGFQEYKDNSALETHECVTSQLQMDKDNE